MKTLWADTRLGLRMLIKHPALTIVGGLGMAVAIAINVGMFTFMLAYIYPTVPLDEGERIVALENRDVARNADERRSLHDFFTWREQLSTVDEVAAYRSVERNLQAAGAPPVAVELAEMTAAGFRVARVSPALGRYLLDEDEQPSAAPVLVLGYEVWQNQFARDAGIVGRQVMLDGVPHTVIGVMRDGYAFPKNHRYWTALRARPIDFARREGPALYVFGRLAPGATLEQAQAELTVLGQQTAAAFPDTHAQIQPVVERFTHSLTDTEGIQLFEVIQIQLMITTLLVVVALNVAILIYARTAARQREIAIRTALGAARRRVVAQLFMEALVLASAAAILGFTLAQFGVREVNRIMEAGQLVAIPFWVDYSIRPAAVLLTVGLAILAATVTGVVPALQATGRQSHGDLRHGGRAGTRLGRTWTALVIAQLAVAVAALPTALNLGWNIVADFSTRPSYAADEFLTAELARDADAAASAGVGTQLPDIVRRLETDGDVAGVTFSTTLPNRTGRIQVEGLTADSPAGFAVASTGVDHAYMQVFGARLMGGRALDRSDTTGNATALVVNDAFVRQVLQGGEALGRRIRYTPAGPWYEVVGVYEDLVGNPVSPDVVTPEVYYPVAAAQAQQAVLNVRLRGVATADVRSRIREVVTTLDPALRLGAVQTMADASRQERLIPRLAGWIVGMVIVSVLLLSAAGIYAMMSFTITQRRKEIAIRAALGAQPSRVLRSVFARAAVQITAGVCAGLVVALLLDTFTGLLDDRARILLPAFGGAMALVALLATLGPARRGLRVQPTEALRGE